MKRGVVLLLLLALFLRLGLAYFQYSGDVKNHLVWADSVLAAGPGGFYGRHFPGYNDANYPPLSIYLFTASRYYYQLKNDFIHWQNFQAKFLPSFLVPLFETLNMQAAFLKLPAILADIGVGYLLYLFSQRKVIAALYLFNPAVVYVSAVWGQIESLPIFFLLLSLYFSKRRYYLSQVAFILAVLSKQTALWLLPVFLILWLKEGGAKKMFSGLALQLAIFFLLYLPFAPPASAVSSFLTTLSGSSTLISDQAFNLWYWLFGAARLEDSQLFLGATIRFWSLGLLGLAVFLICFRLWRRYSFSSVSNSLFWLSLAAFFLMTRVHDRHLAPALPFLLLASYRFRPKLAFYLVLSVYHMINLYLALRLPFI